jgi:glyoxylase I family protein
MDEIRIDEAVNDADVAALWPVYDAIFGDHPDLETWRTSVVDKHFARSGFRLARAYDGDTLVGFGYGYTGERGQWWTDNAAEALGPETAAAWLGGHFELVSIGVVDDMRGRGIGRRLLECLTADLPHDRWLLMTTADTSDPARRMYAAGGWQVIGPGLGADQVIMAKGQARRRFRNPQVILFSEDLPRAAAFYQGLGFVETFRVPTDGDAIHVDLELDGYKIGIASAKSTRDDHGLDPIASGQRTAVILWTDDTSAAYASVTASGATPLAPPHRWLDRLLIAWVADPDGNPVQIVQQL